MRRSTKKKIISNWILYFVKNEEPMDPGELIYTVVDRLNKGVVDTTPSEVYTELKVLLGVDHSIRESELLE